MTAWLDSPAELSFDHEVNLLPQIAATAVGTERAVAAPATSLTVIMTERDRSGRPWTLVETSDGRAGWVQVDLTRQLGQLGEEER
jgi:hypothetical protein